MTKLKNTTAAPFYKTGPLYLHNEKHDGPKDPKDLKDPKKPAATDAKKKKPLVLDRFAKYRNFPGAKPVSFRPDGSVTMMDEKGHTFGLKR
jgi:hypothetical protein